MTTRFVKPDEVPWTELRWRKLVALIFLIQLGLLFWAGNPVKPPVAKGKASRFVLLIRELSPRDWEEKVLVNDPMLFSLPDPRGFSGKAWSHTPHPVPPAAEWNEPVRLLKLDERSLAMGVTQFIQTNNGSSPRRIEKPFPKIENFPILPNETSALRSELRVEGVLARRALLSEVSLPLWKNSQLLNNTIVEVMVNEDGQVLPGRILARSGVEGADALALEIARKLRFQSKPGGQVKELFSRGIEWGKLVFEWGVTNGGVEVIPVPPQL